MANEQVEIHDPFADHNHLKGSEDDDDAEDMDDTVEFKLLMAYAKRRRVNKESPGKNGNRTPSPQTPLAETEKTDDEKTTTTTTKKKKKKKKKGLKRLMNIFTCIKPQTRDEEEEPEPRSSSSPPHDVVLRCGGGLIRQEDGAGKEEEEEEEKELDDAAKSLMKIADQIPFVPPDLETDAPNDDVERLIGLLLRETGDRLNEKELKDLSLAKELFWNYAFFKRIITTLLTRMGMRTSDLGPQASHKTQIAVACEATSRLSAMDTQPMNRLLGYGSRYLKEYYSSWAQEHGGYDAALESDEEVDDDVQ